MLFFADSVPITGGENLGCSRDATLADAGGALMATFFVGLDEDSPSLLRFAIIAVKWAGLGTIPLAKKRGRGLGGC